MQVRRVPQLLLHRLGHRRGHGGVLPPDRHGVPGGDTPPPGVRVSRAGVAVARALPPDFAKLAGRMPDARRGWAVHDSKGPGRSGPAGDLPHVPALPEEGGQSARGAVLQQLRGGGGAADAAGAAEVFLCGDGREVRDRGPGRRRNAEPGQANDEAPSERGWFAERAHRKDLRRNRGRCGICAQGRDAYRWPAGADGRIGSAFGGFGGAQALCSRDNCALRRGESRRGGKFFRRCAPV